MTDHAINSAIAQIAADSQGLLQFYVARHSDYEFIAGKADEGDQEAFHLRALMSAIGSGMTVSGDVLPCLLCDSVSGFVGSGGLAIVGPSPLQPGVRCAFRLLCQPCCAMADAELLRAVTDRWKLLVTPTLRVLPAIHEQAGHG